MENNIEVDKKKIDVEKVVKDLALDQQPKPENKEVKYDQLYEDMVKVQCDRWMELLNDTIIKTVDAERAAWDIVTKHYPDKRTISPYSRIEDMFEYFIGQFKKRHNQYLIEHNLLTKEQKQGIVKPEPVKAEFAEIREIKPVKEFLK